MNNPSPRKPLEPSAEEELSRLLDELKGQLLFEAQTISADESISEAHIFQAWSKLNLVTRTEKSQSTNLASVGSKNAQAVLDQALKESRHTERLYDCRDVSDQSFG